MTFRRPRQALDPRDTGLFPHLSDPPHPISPTRRFVYGGDTPFGRREAVHINQWTSGSWNRALAFHHLLMAGQLRYLAQHYPEKRLARKFLARESIKTAKSYEDKVRLP